MALGPGPPLNQAEAPTPTTADAQPMLPLQTPGMTAQSAAIPAIETPTQAQTVAAVSGTTQKATKTLPAERLSTKKTTNSPPTITSPSQPTASVWSTARVDQLKMRMTGASTTKKQPVPDTTREPSDERRYGENYRCARAAYHLRTDGSQRTMTQLEEQTLQLWASQQIHLTKPPAFVAETHIGAERDILWTFQRDRLGYRLYAVLPTGFRLPAVNTKWHFCRALLAANPDGDANDRAKDLVRKAHRIMCSARSQIAEFVFTRPDERDRWSNKSLSIGHGRFSLRATDSLAKRDATEGYDAAALSLLYQVHVIGRSDLDAATVRAWVGKAADATILTVDSREPTGLTDFGPHRWIVTFDVIECPLPLESKRMLRVTANGRQSLLYLHHPRASTRLPCSACLSTQHYRKDCSEPDAPAKAAKFICDVAVNQTIRAPILTGALTVQAFCQQMKEIRKHVAPELAAKHRAQKKARKAEAVQAKAKQLAEEVAAAAKVRNAAAQQKQAEDARAKQRERDARRELHDRVTAELKGERKPTKPRSGPRRSVHRTSATHAGDDAVASQVTTNTSPTATAAESAETPFCPTHSGDAVMSEPTVDVQSEKHGADAPSLMTSSLDVSMSQGLDETLRVDDLASGAVTPPTGEASLPLPKEVCEAFRTECSEGMIDAWTPKPTIVIDAVQTASQSQSYNEEHCQSPAAPPQLHALGTTKRYRQQELLDLYKQIEATRATDDHSQTLSAPRARKTPVGASAEVTAAARGFADWQRDLDIMPLPVSQNGHCLYEAIRGAVSTSRAHVIPPGSVIDQVGWIKHRVLSLLDDRLHHEVASNQIDPRQMLERLAGESVPMDMELDAMLCEIKKHTANARAILSSETLPFTYWGGTDEIRMASLVFGTTVLVFDLQPSGEAHILRFSPGECSLDPRDPARIAKMHCVTSTVAVEELHPMIQAGEAIALERKGKGRSAHFTAYSIDLANDIHRDVSTPANGLTGAPITEQKAAQLEAATPLPLSALTIEAAIVGTKSEILSLDVKGKAVKKQRQLSNTTAAREWLARARRNKVFAVPAANIVDTTQLAGWIPAYTVALAAMVPALPFPIDLLRSLSKKKLIEFGHCINSDNQHAVIRHHAQTTDTPVAVRSLCSGWDKAVSACPPGQTRWRLTDDLDRWNRLDSIDPTLLTATITDEPLEANEWAVTNVLGLVLPVSLPAHPVVGVQMPATKTSLYWASSPVRDAAVQGQHDAVKGIAVDNRGGSTAGRPVRQSVADFFHPVSPTSHAVHTATEFTGFPKSARVDEWFGNFRQQAEGGPRDVVLLQETHVVHGEADALQQQYARSWGFYASGCRPLSFWTESASRTAGVAVLLNPYASGTAIEPWKAELWTSHWMAVVVRRSADICLVINIYAPTNRTAREALFSSLLSITDGFQGWVLLAGDFNCTLDGDTDRSLSGRELYHDSPALRRILDEWALVDTLAEDAARAREERDTIGFHRLTHTYFYTTPGGITASSRLDRFYVSTSHADWIRTISQDVSGPPSDHNGVTARIAAPGTVVRVRRPRRVYPPPLGCQAHATAVVADFVQAASDKAEALPSPDAAQRSSATELAQWWDQHKTELRKRLLREYKRARQAMTSSYRQRLARLLERLDSARTTHNETGTTTGLKVSELRAQVARCRLERQRQKRERLMRSHLHRPDDTSKRFFARVSTKYSDNTITDLGGNAGHGPARSQELAEDMADGWRSIMQRATIDARIARDFLAAKERRTTTLLTNALSASITEDEVAAALKKCKRGKACGPDELGNDFYRDHAELLTPILTRLYNYWFHAGVAPVSFGTANIQCLRKSTYAAKPLDHRPIALLNTDYKVYTKVFASRLRRLLPSLLDSAQTGFVPGRSIATAIDSLLAAQRAASFQEESTEPVAILLDIAKAYDSIQRPFLLEALRWVNLPERFVAMVESLHTTTSSRFIVNGYLSRPITVTSGIRQGCPLAPLLFVIALDPLHRSLRACEHFDGITLGTAEQSFELKNCGYADDTAIYCSDVKQIRHALEVMDAFSAVSGLHVNRDKSIILPLKGTTELGHATIHDIRVLTTDEHCRYLGIEVGPADTHEANWVACLHSLRTRLALARAKTHTVEQRARLAAAIVVPKVTFVARHSWPAQATINLLHDLIKKFVWGARSRPWVPERQSQLSQALGGLGVPDIESELIAMSTHAVGRWATNATPYERLLGDILQNRSGSVPVFITPLVTTPKRQRPAATMWQTGTLALQRLLRDRVLGDDAQTLTSRASRFVAANTGDHHPDGSYSVNVGTEMSGLTANELLSAERRSGQFDQRWLERASITSLEWLRDARGNHYRLAPTLIPPGATVLADIVRWTWVQHGTTRFYPAQDMTHATSARRRAFARFCVALAFNFPHIMCRPVLPGTVTSFNRAVHEHHEWTLTEQGTILNHHKHGFLSHTHTVATMHECESVASSHVPGGNAQLHSHPLLTRIVYLWHGHVQWQPRRATIRRQVRACLTTLGEAQRDSACGRGDHSDLLDGLDMLEWRDTQRVFATNAYVAQSLFRLKANRFPLWNRAAGNLSCPHNGCSDTTTATLKHIFWECSAAQRWWSNLTVSWSRLGIDLGSDAITWIFGLELPNAPQQAWNAVTASLHDTGGASDIRQHLLGSMNVIWRAQVAESIHGIWNERLRQIEDAERDDNIGRVITVATHQRVLRRIRALAVQPSNRDATAADKMVCALADFLLAQAEPAAILPAPKTDSSSSVFILFFDGGSRGNPGPGGSGSIIVRVSPNSRQATTIWVASMAYSNRQTTNNVAEYRGLLHGLQYAQRHGMTPLHVVGDSSLIINQIRHRRPPRSARLRPLYFQARSTADEIGVASWAHHYRENNKMADAAANVAMDEKKSQQCEATSHRDIWQRIEVHLSNDVSQWLDNAAEQPHQTMGRNDRRHHTPLDRARAKYDQAQQHLAWAALNYPHITETTAEQA